MYPYPSNPFPDPILPESDDQQPSSTSRILLVVNLPGVSLTMRILLMVQIPEIVMRLVDTLLVEAGQIELEGVLELLGEGPFLRNLGGTGV